LTGERLLWFRIASHLGMTVWQCQINMSSAEFVEWSVYLDMEPNMFHREDFYWARMIQLLKAQLVKNPNRIKLEDCLMRFEPKQKTNTEKSAAAKSFFGRLLGAANVVKKRQKG